MESGVLGVTSIDDELFVLLHRDDKQVPVYSVNDYQLLRYLNLPGFKPDLYSDMTSCVRHKCLYMSNFNNRCIHRYELGSKFGAKLRRVVRGGSRISKWPVSDKPCCLSVTPSCNLLVTCRCQDEPSKLVELSADSGQCVREIALSDTADPWHGVQLTTGQFVVCHGYRSSDLHQVCLVDDDGAVARSYGGEHGSDVGHLDWPYHLAVDEDSQFVFVADHGNDRVVLLSTTLEFVRYVIEELSDPRRLYFHQATRRLFVGHRGGVTVLQFSSVVQVTRL